MKKRMERLMGEERGQGMTEYIIIVALIAIAAIGIVSIFGQNLRAVFTAATNALAGEENAVLKGAKKDNRATRKTLENFGRNQ